MNRFTSLSTVIALSLAAAAPAFANDQVANSVGAAPGQLTTAEIAFLKTADPEQDRFQIAQILNGNSSETFTASTKSGASSAKQELAASLGVDAGGYTLSELATLKSADSDEDRAVIQATLDQTGAATAAPTVTPARAQLAASLGLDASTATLPELAAAKSDD